MLVQTVNCVRGDNWSWKAAKRQCGFWLASADSGRRGVYDEELRILMLRRALARTICGRYRLSDDIDAMGNIH